GRRARGGDRAGPADLGAHVLWLAAEPGYLCFGRVLADLWLSAGGWQPAGRYFLVAARPADPAELEIADCRLSVRQFNLQVAICNGVAMATTIDRPMPAVLPVPEERRESYSALVWRKFRRNKIAIAGG